MRALLAATLCLALGACVDPAAQESADASLPHAPIAPRANVGIADATVALISLEGAPAPVSASFRQAVARAFVAHGVVAAEPRKARYLVRGYLSATPATGGGELEYVWDVFGANRARVARLNDVVALKGTGDAWSLVDDAALEAVAARSAEDLAAALSYGPEAKPVGVQAVNAAE